MWHSATIRSESSRSGNLIRAYGSSKPSSVWGWSSRPPLRSESSSGAHRLVVEERHVVFGAVVVAKPGGLVGQQAEGDGMGLRKPELDEGGHGQVL